MARPDQSLYLAHFTKDGRNYDGTDGSHENIDDMSALERLVNILNTKEIKACNLPWTNKKAVCFTECPWGSLLQHAKAYSPYGIGFTKRLIYSRGGNPVIYANPDMFNSQKWDKNVYPFLTPFVPDYATDRQKNKPPFNGKTVDYSHEREWRVAKNLKFVYKNVVFVVLNKFSDIKEIPDEIVKEIGEEKFIFMDTYKKIEELWPIHLIEQTKK